MAEQIRLSYLEGLGPDLRRELAEMVCLTRDERVKHFSSFRLRVRDMYRLVNNQWDKVFGRDLANPDGSVKLPMVANDFQNHVEDVGNLFGAQVPSSRCFPEKRGDPESVRSADDRENALYFYQHRSGFWNSKRDFGMDAAAAGLWAIRVIPEMGAPPSQRFPKMTRLHPLNVLPEPRWTPGEENRNVLVQQRMTFREVSDEFPDATDALLNRLYLRRKATDEMRRGPQGTPYGRAAVLSADPAASAAADARGVPDELEVLTLFTDREMLRVLVLEDEQEGEDYELAGAWINPTGMCFVQCGTRSAWSLEPMGLMESAKGIVRGKERFFQLVLAYATELVWGGRIVYGVQNPDASGVGARFLALTKDAFVRPVVSELNAQWAQVLGLLDQEGHDTAMAPRARGGEVELNKATAAFLTKATGRLTSLVSANQDGFSVTVERANSVAMAIDETMCNAEKNIRGIGRGRTYSTTYTPSKLFDGDYSNVVDYGAFGGVDDQTRDIMIERQLAAGTISVERAVELNPNVEEHQLEMGRLLAQKLLAGIELGFQLPNVPLYVRMGAYTMAKQGHSIEEIEEKYGPVLEQIEQAAMGGGPPGAPGAGGPSAPPLGPNGAAGSPAPSMPPREALAALGR